ncbi:MAG: rod shape-determining protein MreC [Pseudomonadota bacterium]
MRVFLAALGCIILMLTDLRTDLGEAPRGWLMATLHPLQVTVATPTRLLDWSEDATVSRADLARENARLKRERLLADARLQQLASLRAENDRLRTMLDATPSPDMSVQVARLLEVDSEPFRHRITLDKGATNGVYERQAIIDAQGVVGQITQVGPTTSNAVLISDPGHAIQVEVIRNGLRTVAFGAGDVGLLELRFLPNNTDIKVGDLLVTTSLAGDYPAGYPVGEVLSVELEPRAAFARVTATPSASLATLREVLLLNPETIESETDE